MQQLHLVCANGDTPSVLEYVLLTKEEIWASDGHCGVIHSTKNLFGEDFYDSLKEDDRYLIHGIYWKKLCKRGIISIELENGKIKTIDRKGFIEYLPLEKEIVKFPSLHKVFPFECEGVVNIVGLNPVILQNLQLALYPDKPTKQNPHFLYLTMSRENERKASGAIRVYIEDEYDFQYKAIIMPVS